MQRKTSKQSGSTPPPAVESARALELIPLPGGGAPDSANAALALQIALQRKNAQLEAARAMIDATLSAYTELYDLAPVPYLTLDRAGKIVEINLAGARLLGFERARLLDKRITAFLADADRRPFANCLKTLFADGIDARCELALLASDGEICHLDARLALARDGMSCLAVLIDISASQALWRQSDVFNLAREAMMLSDQAGLVVDINQAFSAITGYTRAQIVGQPASMIVSAPRPAAIEEAINCALAFGDSWSGAVMHRHSNGDLQPATEIISELNDYRGNCYRLTRFARPPTALPEG